MAGKPQDIRIRELTPQDSQADFDRLLPAYLALWNHPDNLPYLLYNLVTLEARRIRFEFMQHRMLGQRYFAAMAGQEIVGLSVLKSRPADRFEIEGIAVDPHHKRMGIGRQLVRHAAIIAAWDGFTAMRASVFRDNGSMLSLLQREGFEVVAVSKEARADKADLLFLGKEFPSAVDWERWRGETFQPKREPSMIRAGLLPRLRIQWPWAR